MWEIGNVSELRATAYSFLDGIVGPIDVAGPQATFMLVLSNIHSLLTKILVLPQLHTAAVFTPAGQLICWVSEPIRPKDEVLLVVGLSGELWQGTREKGYGMLESDVRYFLKAKGS